MSKTNIMIVEDSGIVLLDIQKNLKNLGYTVVATASTKEDAIRKAEQTRPDLVLMDIRLGDEMGGFTLPITSRLISISQLSFLPAMRMKIPSNGLRLLIHLDIS